MGGITRIGLIHYGDAFVWVSSDAFSFYLPAFMVHSLEFGLIPESIPSVDGGCESKDCMVMIDFNQNQSAGRQKSSPRRWIELHVRMQGARPPISRVILVPADATFGWLHAVLQISMGWTNSHLHQFIVNGKCVSDPKSDLEPLEEGTVLDENKVRLNELLIESNQTFLYEYDFGDSWSHKITVQNASTNAPVLSDRAFCLEGEGACPPEDCGGLPGYAELLRALKDKKHPEHKSMQEWLGRPFDPAHFLPEKANLWLAKLKWPKVTESALRKILMARDGYVGE